MQLTEHFNLAELTDSDTAVRLGIDNTPSDIVLDHLKHTAAMGEMIRDVLGKAAGKEIIITITSGYRSEKLEKELCAKDYARWCVQHGHRQTAESWNRYFANKAHPQGRAIDFKAFRFGTPFAVVRELQKHSDLMAGVDQLIMEGVTSKGDGWVHAGWSDTPRHEVLTAQFDADGVPFYSHGLT